LFLIFQKNCPKTEKCTNHKRETHQKRHHNSIEWRFQDLITFIIRDTESKSPTKVFFGHKIKIPKFFHFFEKYFDFIKIISIFVVVFWPGRKLLDKNGGHLTRKQDTLYYIYRI